MKSNALYNLIISIGESIYQTLIYDNRYKFILEGLFNTMIIALFAVIIGIIIGILVALIRNNYDRNNKKLLFIILQIRKLPNKKPPTYCGRFRVLGIILYRRPNQKLYLSHL